MAPTAKTLPPPVERPEIADKIESGEYFREVRFAHHTLYSDIITERYFYWLVMLISSLILLMTLSAIDNFLPLNKPIPFVYKTADITEELPRIQRLGSVGNNTEAAANLALRQFLAWHYVQLREEYNVQLLDRNASGIRAHSSDEVFEQYKQLMNPQNPLSPIALFQRNITRKIEYISAYALDTGKMVVEYDEVVEGGRERKKARMRANITFRFSEIAVDQKTGVFTPLDFLVTDYQTQKLQDF